MKKSGKKIGVDRGSSRDRLIRDQDRGWYRFSLRDRDRKSLRRRPRPEKNEVIIGFLDFFKNILRLKFAHKLVL